MVGKKIAPAAKVALKNALSAVYWYKRETSKLSSRTPFATLASWRG
jgi:hypothetical protein